MEKKLVAMQPYFLPYAGYFALLSRADHLVFLDSDQFVTRRWMNRCLVELNNSPKWLTVPLQASPQSTNINKKTLASETSTLRKTIETFGALASKSKIFLKDDLAEAIKKNKYLSDLNIALIELVASRTSIPFPEIHRLSDLKGFDGVNYQERAANLCEIFECNTYLNASGGRALYDQNYFYHRGLRLEFMPEYSKIESDKYSVLSSGLTPQELKSRITNL